MNNPTTPASPRQPGIPQENQAAARPNLLLELLAQWRTEPPLAPQDQFPETIDPRAEPEDDF